MSPLTRHPSGTIRRFAAGAVALALFLAGCSESPVPQPASSAPSPDASTTATPAVPRPVRVSGFVTTRWVSTYGTDDFETGDGDRCRSSQVKAGDSIRLATTVDTSRRWGRGEFATSDARSRSRPRCRWRTP